MEDLQEEQNEKAPLPKALQESCEGPKEVEEYSEPLTSENASKLAPDSYPPGSEPPLQHDTTSPAATVNLSTETALPATATASSAAGSQPLAMPPTPMFTFASPSRTTSGALFGSSFRDTGVPPFRATSTPSRRTRSLSAGTQALHATIMNRKAMVPEAGVPGAKPKPDSYATDKSPSELRKTESSTEPSTTGHVEGKVATLAWAPSPDNTCLILKKVQHTTPPKSTTATKAGTGQDTQEPSPSTLSLHSHSSEYAALDGKIEQLGKILGSSLALARDAHADSAKRLMEMSAAQSRFEDDCGKALEKLREVVDAVETEDEQVVDCGENGEQPNGL